MCPKDRQSREAARIVGGIIAEAQSHSQAGVISGIWIERNPNLGNAANQIFRIRAPRPFSGYGANANALVTPAANTAVLPVEFGTSATSVNLININDRIQFNQRGPLYRIIDVRMGPTNAQTEIEYEQRVIDPPIPGSGVVPMLFKVFRRPVRVETSLTQLPKGYVVDLSQSGHGPGGFQFAGGTGPLIITFDGSGQIDQIYVNGLDDLAGGVIPTGPVHLLVAENDVESGIPSILNTRNLWVSVNHLSGQTGVYSMAQSDSSLTQAQQLTQARTLARTGKSAAQ